MGLVWDCLSLWSFHVELTQMGLTCPRFWVHVRHATKESDMSAEGSGEIRSVGNISHHDDVVERVRERLGRSQWGSSDADQRLLTNREVADFLAVSTRTVSRFVDRGELRAIYLTDPRRTRRFRVSDVREFIQSKTVRN